MTRDWRRRLGFEQLEPRWNGAVDTLAAASPALPAFDGHLRLGSVEQPLFEGTKEELLSYLADGGVGVITAAENLSIEIVPAVAEDGSEAQPSAAWSREDWEPVIGEVQGAFGVLHALLDQFFRDEILVQYHLVVTDPAGTPILASRPNDQIVVHVEVEDFRGTPLGVWGAATSLFYTSQNLVPVGGIRFGSQFNQQQQVGMSSPGRIENVGAQLDAVTSRPGRTELFAATFRVTGEGPIVFSTTPLESGSIVDSSAAWENSLVAVQLVGVDSPVPADRVFSLPTILGSFSSAISDWLPLLPATLRGFTEESLEPSTRLSVAWRAGTRKLDPWQAVAEWGRDFWQAAGTASVSVLPLKAVSAAPTVIRLLDAAWDPVSAWFETERGTSRLLPDQQEAGLEAIGGSAATRDSRRYEPVQEPTRSRTERVRGGLPAKSLQLSTFDRRGTRQFLRMEWRSLELPEESPHASTISADIAYEEQSRILDIAELLQEVPPPNVDSKETDQGTSQK